MVTKKKSLLITTLTIVLVNLSCLKIDKKYKIIFFGDSITYNGLMWQHGYIHKIDSLSKSEGHGDEYLLEGAGKIGNKVGDLHARLNMDVIQYNPDAVVIYIGVNDVNSLNSDIKIDSFKQCYLEIIEKLQKNNVKVIICTPTVIGELKNMSNPKDAILNKYSSILIEISKKFTLPLCDLRSNFLDYINKNNPNNKETGILTNDGIHLNRMGNLVVAKNMWNVIKLIKQ